MVVICCLLCLINTSYKIYLLGFMSMQYYFMFSLLDTDTRLLASFIRLCYTYFLTMSKYSPIACNSYCVQFSGFSIEKAETVIFISSRLVNFFKVAFVNCCEVFFNIFKGQFYRVHVGVQSPEGSTTNRGVLRRFNDFLKLFSDVCLS